MEYEKELTIVLWVIALFGIFLIARGITGNVIANSYSISDSCTDNKECQPNKICCIVNGVGMCSDINMCQQLKEFAKEKPEANKNYTSDIILGLLILMCVLLAVYSATRKINKSKVKKVIRKKRRK